MRVTLSLLVAASLLAATITTAAPASAAVATSRIAGADRFATSVEISRQTPSRGDVVFLANGLKFPDALAAGPVAAAEGGHLLLTQPDVLPVVVAQRIRELDPVEIVVVGSEASVSAAVAQQAAEIGGASIARMDGADRVETSLLLLERLRQSGPVETVWVASGFTFPDALVAASVAGRSRAGVILDHHASGTAATEAWLQRVRPAVAGLRVAIAGGEPSVSAADAAGLRAAGAVSVERYAGDSRYTTAQTINDTFASAPGAPAMVLATGQNFPDALSGAVYSAVTGAPMYLTTNACNAQVSEMLRNEAAERGISSVIALGSGATIDDVALQLGPCPRPLTEIIAEQYGTFSPLSHAGEGSRTIDLGRSIPFAQMRVGSWTEDTFTITALDAGRQPLGELLVVEGRYSGITLLASPDAPVRFLQVASNERWSIEMRDLASADPLAEYHGALQDGVYITDGPTRSVRASHEGGFFAVDQLSDGGNDYRVLVEQCCAPYSGLVTLRGGPSVIAVISDSPWKLVLQQ